MHPVPIQNIAVIGLGTIGHSVAQFFATGGCTVKCFDPHREARETVPPGYTVISSQWRLLELLRPIRLTKSLAV